MELPRSRCGECSCSVLRGLVLLLSVFQLAVRAGGSSPHLWPAGVVPIRSDDGTALGPALLAVLDEVERKTLLHFDRGARGGLVLRGALRGGKALRLEAGEVELDVDAHSSSLLSRAGGNATSAVSAGRRAAVALLAALGVSAVDAAAPRRNSVAAGEADALNELYASVVLPKPGLLPATVEVGVWQLAKGYKAAVWADMVDGRGRRVVAGAMRWARTLPGRADVVGALPTFTFRGNKAEVLLLGQESAELSTGLDASESPTEGLGPSVRRAMLFAWKRHGFLLGEAFVGGVPTFLGDGSVLLLRSSFAESVPLLKGEEQSLEEAMREHHSAQLLARVSRWAQGFGALLALPTFAAPRASGGLWPSLGSSDGGATSAQAVAMDIIVIRGRDRAGTPLSPLAPLLSKRPTPEPKPRDAATGATAALATDAASGGGGGVMERVVGITLLSGCAYFAVGRLRRSRLGETAERELTRIVDSL